MSIHKVTPFISEIKNFFNNKDLTGAMHTIANIFSQIRMTDRSTLGIRDKCNTLYGCLAVFQCLILLPYLGVKNIFRTKDSAAAVLMDAQKDVFYRFLKNPSVTWRKALWSISGQLWNKIRMRTDSHDDDACLILDDTDFHKTGHAMENIGRVFSHLEHKCILGFKCLLMAVTDGRSQLLLDFSIVGEPGKKGNHGLSDKEIKRRKEFERDSDMFKEREGEYRMSKIELAKDLIKRAIRHKIKFKYVLADSWFTCTDIIRFIKSRHVKCHWLGMIKVGKSDKGQGKTRFNTEYGTISAATLAKKAKARKEVRYSRKLKSYYIVSDAELDGMPVRIFLIKRGKNGQWNGLLTTDMSLDIFRAWQLYSMRWSLEVVIKDCKQYLGLGKCRSTNFAAQIADTTVCAIRYNILSVARRFSDYETIGGLFREVTKESVQLSVAQQIWGYLQEIVAEIAQLFGLLDEEVFEVVVNKSDELAHICEFYNLKSAS